MISYKLLGAREWFVVHHSHCGMALLSDENSTSLLTSEVRTPRSSEVRMRVPQSSARIDWQVIHDRRHVLLADIKRIRNHSLFPAGVTLRGYLYQVETGGLLEISQTGAGGADSRAAGRATAAVAI